MSLREITAEYCPWGKVAFIYTPWWGDHQLKLQGRARLSPWCRAHPSTAENLVKIFPSLVFVETRSSFVFDWYHGEKTWKVLYLFQN